MSDPRSPEVQFEALKHERNVLQRICAERAAEINDLFEELRMLLDAVEAFARDRDEPGLRAAVLTARAAVERHR